jgi:hypothetical protein
MDSISRPAVVWWRELVGLPTTGAAERLPP